MKKNIYSLLLFSFAIIFNHNASAQNVGISSNGATPDASAMLDVVSTNKGFLLPRMTSAQRIAISSPIEGLIVYQTDAGTQGAGFYFYNGTVWIPWSTKFGGWGLSGNTGTTASTAAYGSAVNNNFIGTTDSKDFVFATNNLERMRITSSGNVGIGTSTPGYRLDLANGTFAFGNSNVRTESRDNAGLQGNAGAQSGFYETASPTNYPAGATSWWHMIEARHSNNTNNYALQISGSFFDQKLFFRKTNNSATQSWTEIQTSANNPVSVSLSTNYTVTTTGYSDITGMTVSFTATKTTAFVQFTCSGYASLNSMAYVGFRIFNTTTSTSIGGTETHMQSYDDWTGTITPWSCSFSKNITGLTPGTTYTLKVQGLRDGIYGTYNAVINASTLPDDHHMTLTVFP